MAIEKMESLASPVLCKLEDVTVVSLINQIPTEINGVIRQDMVKIIGHVYGSSEVTDKATFMHSIRNYHLTVSLSIGEIAKSDNALDLLREKQNKVKRITDCILELPSLK